MAEITIGVKGRAEKIVDQTNTAKTMGSGSLDVFATPALVAMMEEAAVSALTLSEEQSSVGVSLDIKHTAATPLGMKVWANAELVEVDRRRLVFKLEAYDDKELIGSGTHERFIIDVEKFMIKTQAKSGERE
ncbi:thioesterase superfamily protein [Desulfitobacterium sp. LBE]|uniref:Thioesterase superfamily protein n=1 Tax=Desulfitobacterium hafniense (strain DSM 10664 / DCB-2) TaxID=272564 RepID=B8G028_DESHD|nr:MULTISPECIES: thioesterase family protein [Desulfitobacterium]ACL21089.1 thioesterase superfamily protein [Desulfitobacterium hafniense DCB-2]TWH56093.1 thioesterase superfamily protein [Desulfitobacterium sp. LBE]